jgi:hypothetical protein
LRQKFLYFLIFLIFTTTIFFAKEIGDKATKYQVYNALKSVIKLSQPVHATIDELQKERILSSLYLPLKTPDILESLLKQYKTTDAQLNNFSSQLNETEILLLSIPDSELPKLIGSLNTNREKVKGTELKFSENFHSYSELIAKLETFLEKMYTYTDDPEFAPLITALIDSDLIKESLSKESAYISHHLSLKDIPLGETLIIREMIVDHLSFEKKLDQTIDGEIKTQMTMLYASPERAALSAQRKQFDQNDPVIRGSIDLGRDYFKASSLYLKKLNELDSSILKKLEAIGRAGSVKLKEEIIVSSIVGFLIILLLTGIYFFLQRKAPIT